MNSSQEITEMVEDDLELVEDKKILADTKQEMQVLGDVLPEYAYGYNQNLRRKLYKDLNATSEMADIFDKLCKYVSQENIAKPVVKIDDFVAYLAGKDDVKGIQRKNLINPLFLFIKIIEEENLGLIEVLERNSLSEPDLIVLREKANESERIYEELAIYFERNYAQFIERMETLISKKEVLKKLPITEVVLNGLIQEINTNQITIAEIKKMSGGERPLTLFKGNDFIEDVIILTNRLGNLVEVFVKHLTVYYEDNLNDEIRMVIFKKVREQKIDTNKLSRIVRQGVIDDAYFLFFSQLFYNVMMGIMEKMSQQSVQSVEIYNHCFIAFFLSRLSVNERDLLLKKKKEEDAVAHHFDAIVRGLIEKFTGEGGNISYMPFKIADIIRFPVNNIPGQEGKGLLLLNFYSEKELLMLISKKSKMDEEIPDILSFSSSSIQYYVHRVRLLSSFLTMLPDERQKIEAALLQDWTDDPDKMVNRDKEDEFIDIIENYYASAFFKNYLNHLVNVLQAYSDSEKIGDSSYLLQRLFFTERDKLYISPKSRDLIYKVSDLGKKKYALRNIVEVVFNTKTGDPKSVYEILDISLLGMYSAAMKNLKVGFFKRFVLMTKNWLSTMVMFFQGNKNYLAFLSRRYYQGSVQDSFGQRTDKKGKAVLTAQQEKKMAATPADAPVRDAAKKSKDKSKRIMGVLTKNIPDLKNPDKIKKMIEEQHDLWNIKMGDTRDEMRELIDDRIEDMVDRFDPEVFSFANVDLFYQKIIGGATDAVKTVGDRNALKKYILYRGSYLLYERQKR